jgi:hypothetical protein
MESFPLFPSLPPELRQMVWAAALPPAGSIGKCLTTREVDLDWDAVFVPTQETEIFLIRPRCVGNIFASLLQPGMFEAATDHTLRHLVTAEEALNRD